MLSRHKLRAKVHQVQVAWRVATTREITVGPLPRLVLAVHARRDVELLLVRVDFPALLNGEGRGEPMLAEVPHVTGLRRLRPDGEPWVYGQEDIAARGLEFLAPDLIRPWGATVREGLHCVVASPHDYWCLRCRVSVPKGLSVGVIVRADRVMPCRVRISGV